MKFTLSTFVALAVAVAVPNYAAVVSGGAMGTGASVATGQTITPLKITQNSTAQSTPVSHASADTLHCFGPGSKSASTNGMRDVVHSFCGDYAGFILEFPGGYVQAKRYAGSAAIQLRVQADNGQVSGAFLCMPLTPIPSCETVVQYESCKAQMGRIIYSCGEHGGDLRVPAYCAWYSVYPGNN
ncbi:hypothetical protein DFH06DRAFT_1484625 [Mycena polygramma]|nr:hypothetical protein DFH06DRAFT_1484625 [Mycena polygramma]